MYTVYANVFMFGVLNVEKQERKKSVKCVMCAAGADQDRERERPAALSGARETLKGLL